MSANVYNEKMVQPDEKMLSYDLGETKAYLDTIAGFIASEYGNFKPEWKFYNQNTGWILKMLTKKRNVLFVVPCEGFFRIAFTFGDKAANLILSSELPDTIKQLLLDARKHAEGRTIVIDVKSESDLENILKMIRIKLT